VITVIYACLCDLSVQGRFLHTLTAGGLEVDTLKTDVNFSTVGPYYLGINLTDVMVNVLICSVYFVLKLELSND